MYRFYRNNREKITGLAFVLPATIYLLVMMAYPLFYNFYMSLRNLDVMTFKGNSSVFVGLSNYVALFQDEVFLAALRQTFVFTIWCLVFQFSTGLLLAVFFAGKFKLAGPVRGVTLIAWMMPMAVTGLAFKYMLSLDVGVINYLLRSVGLIKEPVGWLIDSKYAMWGVIMANSWVGIPFNMLLLTTGLSSIPKDVIEGASIDGAGVVQRFFHITIPMLRPAIMSVLMLGFIYTFKVFDLVYMMTNGGPLNATEVLSIFSYRNSFKLYKFSLGSASAVALFLCLMLVGVFYLRLIRKEEAM